VNAATRTQGTAWLKQAIEEIGALRTSCRNPKSEKPGEPIRMKRNFKRNEGD